MVSYDYSSDSSNDITGWKMQELREEVYDISEGTPDGIDRSGEEEFMNFDYPGQHRYCICGDFAPLFTCWAPGIHCGRRYFGCRNWHRKGQFDYFWCTYFRWEDPPFEARSLEVINFLVDREKKAVADLENQSKVAEEKVKRFQIQFPFLNSVSRIYGLMKLLLRSKDFQKFLFGLFVGGVCMFYFNK